MKKSGSIDVKYNKIQINTLKTTSNEQTTKKLIFKSRQTVASAPTSIDLAATEATTTTNKKDVVVRKFSLKRSTLTESTESKLKKHD